MGSAAADRETAPTTVTSAVIMAVVEAVAGLGAAAAAATVAALTGPRPRGQPTGQPTLPTGHLTTRVGGMVEEKIQSHPVPEMASALVRSKFDAMTDAVC